MNAQVITTTMLNQLGGKRFIAMTGSKNFLFADVTETNPKVWLRMDLTKNAAGVNRLKIYYNPDDTYTMEFYKQVITKDFEVKISKTQTFENIYCDQLQEIFTQVTGLYTSL